MADSIDVLATLKLVYMIYAVIAMSIMAYYSRLITKSKGDSPFMTPPFFWGYIAILMVCGTGLHFLTYNIVPWVPTDLTRETITPAKTFDILYEDHKIILEENPMRIDCNTFVTFNAKSNDLTYGFGIFRANHTLVTQMQVVPQGKNDLMWKFTKNGTYYIRSTEYSGPKGHRMIVKDAVIVTGCATSDTTAGRR